MESQVAALLGKPAAVMFPSGTMAQQSTLRVWSDRQGDRRIAIPAPSHLLHHEQDGPRLLNGFEWAMVTTGVVVPTVDHLGAIPGGLGAALLELPLRDGGYLLPSWQELEAFSRACRDRGVPLRLDGARIWESAPHLGHSTAEIAVLADTVYVSFYKGLRGLAGAVVAGPEDVIAEVRLWRNRHGGTLWTSSRMPCPPCAGCVRSFRAWPSITSALSRWQNCWQQREFAGLLCSVQAALLGSGRWRVPDSALKPA